MRVLFVLPGPVRIPMGGAAVVYRHAEGLAARGHAVTVAAPRRSTGLTGRVIAGAVGVRNRLHGVHEANPYAGRGVTRLEPETWREQDSGSFDAVIATGYQTAHWVTSMTKESGLTGFYFLQHDERHLSAAAGETWRLPLVKIAVAQWIAETVEAAGAEVAGVVPNAVDPAVFHVSRPLSDRERRVVALYHRLPAKGPDLLIRALHRLRALDPTVEADVIAARPPRHTLPRWSTVHVRPEAGQLVEIYNRASVCLHTSRLEGWGLVPMEAAACGCAVAATASRGVNEFLVPGRSMLQVPVDDPDGLAEAAHRLLSDPLLRVSIAEAGVEGVGRFSWAASTDAFERLLLAHAP